ncbi:MAG: pyridoxamine 5'-phosphate oxidase family protein [Proteobacteria bacterium]|nr:pyridoxamine 5'-phosphate oxidase family protein [Pseudomonadota bacterium]MBU1582214.1 pyridoxamine 5'-phosphate oxidase family protein [Pseudomonadota bacterium]MBU2455598.1 pyridoxamine 5'-phosphate oxidase family protein [Pseudomonadota bacterium]MBU2627066.1 pyridoxamine 5'-phosphate oxidase family protein [Pseudomonadota bacterium]
MSALETMKQVVETHNLMHVATLDSNGLPCLRGVDYAAGDAPNILYFITGKNSRKVAQLTGNATVAIAIDHDCPTWEDLEKIKYIKGTGVATRIESGKEMEMAFGLLAKKFPFLANLPGDPSDFVGIKIEIKHALVTDNTISFSHTEELTF